MFKREKSFVESLGSVLNFSSGKSAPTKSRRDILLAYREIPWLRAIVSRIATSILDVPWSYYEIENSSKSFRKLKSSGKEYREKIMNKKIKQGELVEIEDSEIIEFIEAGTLVKNGKVLSGKEILKVTQIYLELLGEAFWLIEKTKTGLPLTYWLLNPIWVSDLPTANNPYYSLRLPSGEFENVPVTEIIHFRDIDVINPYERGYGLAQALSDELGADEYASKYINSFFYNRARPDIIISAEGLRLEDKERLEAKWLQESRGFWNAYKPYFISGNVKITELSQSFQSMELVDLRRYERDFILQIFGVPPEIMGIVENSNRATIDAANDIFARWVLVPRLEIIRSVLQSQLLPMFEAEGIIDYESPVSEDKEYILNVAKAAPWSLSLNEWRELQGLEPIENGDVFMTPMNLLPEQKKMKVEIEETKSEKKVEKTISRDKLRRILEQVNPAVLVSVITSFWLETIERHGKRSLFEINIDEPFNPRIDRINDFVEKYGAELIKGINETTRDKLRKELEEGIANGESIAKLSDRISKVFEEAKGYRAERIARTETIRAANFGAYEGYQQGNVEQKRWLATMDERVRDAHADADMQVRDMDEPFDVGGEKLMYPGDYAGSAGNVINCRCTIEPIINQRAIYDTVEKRERVWKEFDSLLRQEEKEFQIQLKKAFQKQQDAVNEELRKE